MGARRHDLWYNVYQSPREGENKMVIENWMDTTAGIKKTSIVEARVDARTLAALLRFFQHRGLIIRTKSELVCMALETLNDMLIVGEHTERVTSTQEAILILETGGLGLGRRNERALLAQLGEESRMAEAAAKEDSNV